MKQIESIKPLVLKYRNWIAAAVGVAVFALMIILARGVGSKDMALLYSGLDNRASADIVAALDANGTGYEIRGDAIFVPAAERDLLRIKLAGEGLPNASVQGYEILDGLSGFGTTSQMFDAAYWRAKEGELARTLLASQNIRAARVHISAAANRPFATQSRTTAAVTITTYGAIPNPAQILAMRHLIAAAVPDLSPEDVAIIDSAKGLLSAETTTQTTELSDTLRARVLRMLEARVGYGNAVVEIAVDTEIQSEQIIERTIDPTSRTAISSDIQETSSSSQDSSGGQVTVASNLPTGDANANGSSSGETLETRTVTNYEISEIQREIVRSPGAVRRLSVAVLINETDAPRDEDELDALRALVSSAVGYDPTRGDEITLYSMPFDQIPDSGTAIENPAATPLDTMKLIQIAVLALVTIIMGLFVLRPLVLPKQTPMALPDPDVIDAVAISPTMAEMDVPPEDPSDRLKRLMSERQRDSLKILQSWVDPVKSTGDA